MWQRELGIFGRMLAVAAKTSNALDPHNILIYPVTEVLPSLSQSDRTLLKTDREVLTHIHKNN